MVQMVGDGAVAMTPNTPRNRKKILEAKEKNREAKSTWTILAECLH